jgi:hypothetical protein
VAESLLDALADTPALNDIFLGKKDAADARGVRLGCEFQRAGGDAVRALQRFIDHTQKRGKLLALD